MSPPSTRPGIVHLNGRALYRPRGYRGARSASFLDERYLFEGQVRDIVYG
jgi:hypothetical protein